MEKKARVIELVNKNGLKCSLSNFGARILGIRVPLSDEIREIVVSLTNDRDIEDHPFFGAIVGRMAGRVRNGLVKIEGKKYQLEQNEVLQTLHGGKKNLSNRYWKVKSFSTSQVTFTFFSPDGENGFPGNLFIEVIYKLTDLNELQIHFRTTTDQVTVFNPTNHIFFNLDGDSKYSIDKHTLQIQADRYLTLDNDNLPLKEEEVTDTIFDFRKKKCIKTALKFNNQQIKINKGLNHPFILNKNEPQAILISKDKKITMEMLTTQSAVVVYTTGKSLANLETNTGKLRFSGAIALEAQMPPGTENSLDFEKIIIRPNKVHHVQTTYKIIF